MNKPVIAAGFPVPTKSPDQDGVPGTPLVKDFAETWYSEKEVEWRRSHKLNICADIDSRIISRRGHWEAGRSAMDTEGAPP